MVIDSEDDNAIAQVEKSQEISLLNSSIPLLSKIVSEFNSSERIEKCTNIFAMIFHDEKKKKVMPHPHQKGSFNFVESCGQITCQNRGTIMLKGHCFS